MGIKSIKNSFVKFLNYIGSIGVTNTDTPETRSHKIIITVALYVAIANLVYFAFVYWAMGRFAAAYTLLVCSIIHIISLILFRFHRNFKFIRDSTFIVMYFYIIFYHVTMGGYVKSVEYIMYGIPILNGTQIFYKDKRWKWFWYAAYMVMAIVLYFLEPIISQGVEPLPDSIVLLTKFNNFVLIASMVILSISYFIAIIRAEKQKSDVLIRNILPSSVVEELNDYGISKPIFIPQATVVFMDFSGFTQLTENLSPQEMVTVLNEHFVEFDKIFKSHNVEKLKTIGDGYMAVGGVPEENKTHPLDVALACLKILHYMQNKSKDKDWKIRIGIHTGPMVAGIIGESKFSYDVWGHTINLCSRLESSGVTGSINVSEDFYQNTRDIFEFEERGFIEIKNGPPVKMYLLKDLKPQLRQSPFHPNKEFYDIHSNYSLKPLEEPVA